MPDANGNPTPMELWVQSQMELWVQSQLGSGAAGGAGNGTWALVEGGDGRTYERNSTTGETRLAPAQFQKKQESVSLGYRSSSDYGDRVMGRGGSDPRSITTYIGERDIPLDSGLARQAAMTGGLGLADSWKVFADAGLPDSLIKDFLLGDTSGGGGGSGVGYAQLAQRQAEFEYEKQRQKQRDSVADAMALFDAIAGQQSLADARAKAMRDNQLAALGSMVDPSVEYFPGMGPSDPMVGKYHSTSPVKVQHMAYDPSLGSNQYDAAVANALDTFRRVSAGG